VGGASFELARKVPQVLGVDFSNSFIRTAQTLARRGTLRFPLKLEGVLSEPSLAHIRPKTLGKRVCFRAGDALDLPPVGMFDLVLAANLIDRVRDPKKLLQKVLPALVRPGGVLLLTSPYTWSKEFTPPSRWPKDSFSTIHKLLLPHFRLVHRQNLPFLLREHRRKFQLTFADATLWVRTR